MSIAYREPKQVSIRKAANGFVISSYTNKGETVEVAKTYKDAQKIAKRLLRAS